MLVHRLLFLKYTFLGATPSDFDSVNVGWGFHSLQASPGLRYSSILAFLDLFSSFLLPNVRIPKDSLTQSGP